MYSNGTSALNNASMQRISTPKLRVSLTQNFKVEYTDHRLPTGATDTGYLLTDMETIDDKLVTSRLDDIGANAMIVTFDQNGSTYLNIIRTFGGYTKFVKSKGILYAFTGRVSGTTQMMRRGTTDGINWFGDTHWTVTAGASIFDFAPVSPTRMYTIHPKPFGATNGYRLINIKLMNHLSGAWEYDTAYDVEDVYDSTTIEGYDMRGTELPGGKDAIIYRYSNSISAIEGIKVAVLDASTKRSPHGEFSVIDPIYNPGVTGTGPLRQFHLSNIARGNSFYYISINAGINNYGVRIGSDYDPIHGQHYWMRSRDFINWSAPVPYGNSNGFVAAEGIISGITDGIEFTAMGVSTLQDNQFKTKHILREADEIDISDDILTYQNDSNNRISLVINNSK